MTGRTLANCQSGRMVPISPQLPRIRVGMALALLPEDAIVLMGGGPCGRGSARYSVGTPDALSRNGAVGRAFDTDAIRFAPSQGRFEMARATNASRSFFRAGRMVNPCNVRPSAAWLPRNARDVTQS